MTHARIPNFSTCLPSRTLITRTVPHDPIHAAIERHRAAVEDYQLAPSLLTNEETDAALHALVVTACATRAGAAALLAHLRTFLKDEAEFAEGWWPSYPMAQARAGDLALLLGADMPPVAIPPSFPSGQMSPAAVLQLPPRPAAPLHLRVIRSIGAAGELVSAIAIIGVGAWLVGHATTL